MAYKQPRVPQMRDGARLTEIVRELVLFLKDFCMETWVQVTKLEKRGESSKGEKGEKGDPGEPGADGISPIVAVQDIDGGHRVTITDAEGSKTFDVMDGKDGADGSGGAAVQSDWDENDPNSPAYVKGRTHWLERPYEPIVWDGSTEGRDSVDLSLALGYPEGSVIAYKISDHLLTKGEVEASTVYTKIGDETAGDPDASYDDSLGLAIINYSTMHYVDGILTDFAVGTLIIFPMAGDLSDVGLGVIPSAGLYAFLQSPQHELRIDADVYHTIDKRYLPDTYATKEYVDDLITGAIGGSY